MAVTDARASDTIVAAGSRDQVVKQAGHAGCRRGSMAGSALVAISASVIVLAACGSIPSTHTSAQSLPSSSAAVVRATGRSRIDGIVTSAKATYRNESKGAKLFQQLGRIARDGVLLGALSRGDLVGAQAEADAQLRSPVNHLAHVTRISVLRGSRVLVNATENSDGVFVVAPGRRTVRLHGRLLGTLLVSLQDVTGFVKLVHHLTGAEVLVRGASGHVRTSLGAAVRVRLPMSGYVTIAGRRYFVRSFREIGWANEPLTVWILGKPDAGTYSSHHSATSAVRLGPPVQWPLTFRLVEVSMRWCSAGGGDTLIPRPSATSPRVAPAGACPRRHRSSRGWRPR
jgi:CBS domain-containing protein